MDKILIIDGNSLANRAFYALPFLSNHEGQPTGAVFGFANILIKIISELKPNKIAVAFDHSRKTFRNEIYSQYKAQRKETPKELVSQFPLIKKMLKAMGICTLEVEGIEADDIIGTLSKQLNGEKYLLSGDRDLLQLISDNTFVWLTKKGVSVVEKVDRKRLKELYGLLPEQIVDLKALMGDSSDNIPGVSGVGEKTALGLLEQFGDLEKVYKNLDQIKGKLKEKLENDKDCAFLSQKLATIKCDCHFDYSMSELDFSLPFSKDCYNLFQNWDFSSLLRAELFGERQETSQENSFEKAVLDQSVLEKMSKISEGEFIYNLQKLEFIFNGKLYYLEQNFQMFDGGLSFEEIQNAITKYRDERDLYFILQKFDNLVNNGRMSRIAGLIASTLVIRPICIADNGEIKIAKKTIGIKNAISKMVQMISEKTKDIENKQIIISHCYAEEEVAQIKAELDKKCHFKQVRVLPTKGLCSYYALEKGVIVCV